MYTSYTAAALTLRAKGSLSYTHLSLSDDRRRCCCCSGSSAPSPDLSIFALSLTPKLLYGYCLRQSALLHCSPSRTFLSAAAAARSPRFVNVGSCRTVCSRPFVGSYQEVIGLLADIDSCYDSCYVDTNERSGSGRASRREECRCRSSSRSSSSLSGDSGHKGDWHRRAAREDSAGYGWSRYEGNEEDGCETVIQEDVERDFRKNIDSRRRDDSARASSLRRVSGWEGRDRKDIQEDVGRAVRKNVDYRRRDDSARVSSLRRVSGWEGRDRNDIQEDVGRDFRKKVDSQRRDDSARESSLRRVSEWEARGRKDIQEDVRRDFRSNYDSQQRDDSTRASSSRKVSDWEGRDRNDIQEDVGRDFRKKVDSQRRDDSAGESSLRRVSEWEARERKDIQEDVRRDFRSNYDSRQRDDSTRASSSRKVSDWEDRFRKEGSQSFTNWNRESREGYLREEQRGTGKQDSRDGSKKLIFTPDVHVDDANRASNSRGAVHASESYSGSNVKRHSKIDQRVVGSTKLSSYSTDLKEISVVDSSNTKRASDSQKQIEEERPRDKVDSSTPVQYSIAASDQRVPAERQTVDKLESNQQYENRTNVSRIHASDTVNPGSSEVHARMGIQEQCSTSSVNLVHRESEQHNKIDERASRQSTSRIEVERVSRLSELSRSEIERVSGSQMTSDSRTGREYYSTSVENVVRGATEQQNQTDNRIGLQYSSRRASERDSRLSALSNSEVERVSDSLGMPIVRLGNQEENSSASLVRDKKDKQSTLIGGTSQASSGILYGSSSSSHTRIQALDDQTSRDEMYQLKDNRMESASRLDKSTTVYVGEFVDKLRQELSTSDELDKASRHYSEIQVEDINRGASQTATDVQSRVLDSAASSKREKYVEESARHSSSRSGMKGPPDEMWHVRDSYSEEPSMPDEPEEDSSTTRVPNPTTANPRTHDSITRRSHRSMWTYIADIIKASWVLRSGSQNSTFKSGTRSSSNESVSSEAWFSGHEPDENDDETDRKVIDGASKESVQVKSHVNPSHLRIQSTPSQASSEELEPGNRTTLSGVSSSISKGSTRNSSQSKGAPIESRPEELQGSKGEKRSLGIPFSTAIIEESSSLIGIDGASKESVQVKGPVDSSYPRIHSAPSAISEASGPGSRITLSRTSSSTSKGSARRGSLSKGASYESKPEELQASEEEKGSVGIPSIAATTEQPSPLTSYTALTTEDAIVEIGNGRTPGSSFLMLEAKEDLSREKLPEVGGTEIKDGELKRRKLQRNKQVLRERFDEWEEAYNRESEQRNIDEFFMREALLEAKKAADTWEVPVGAVLVQNGEIIARGCNLVEEARDSTAHAEMICIREASSLLRSWRLSDTTLYVTLEPCAMCAGAILQARIDTVVWGAPNKLLGADGSWVRLFPGGDVGSNSSDMSSQTTGPVHPFHPKITIRRGILATECSDVMQQFFQLRRKKKKSESEPPSCLPISTHPTKLFGRMHDLFRVMFCL